ncbi:MAG TPA: hypothetical protein VM012_04180 [Flavitalea sp.]|nr:hypothetical protein [Flavitalea sp.]
MTIEKYVEEFNNYAHTVIDTFHPRPKKESDTAKATEQYELEMQRYKLALTKKENEILHNASREKMMDLKALRTLLVECEQWHVNNFTEKFNQQP